jgi:hypothetical protein
MSGERQSRRRFLAALPFGALALLVGARPLKGHRRVAGVTWCGPHGGSERVTDWEHPEPREGIDASKVLTADKLSNPAAAPVYDQIREIPEMADGVRCHCGCAELPGYRSLLTCFEEGGMAQWCVICQGQAKLLYSRHKEGQSLERIRNAIDARFG